MKISRANWTLSLDSYQELVDGLEAGEGIRELRYNFFGTPCGYCDESYDRGIGRCLGSMCLFYSGICAEAYGGYYMLGDCLKNNNRPKALRIAKNILQAIKDDEVNVYEEGE
jgi:hypothetical protein